MLISAPNSEALYIFSSSFDRDVFDSYYLLLSPFYNYTANMNDLSLKEMGTIKVSLSIAPLIPPLAEYQED